MYGTSQAYRCGTCTGCGSCSSGGLETIASSSVEYEGASSSSSGVMAYEVSSSGMSGGYSPEMMMVSGRDYSGSSDGTMSYQSAEVAYNFARAEKNYRFAPDNFLVPGKEGHFVGQAEEIKSYVEEAFEKIFDCPFPSDVKVSVLNAEKFGKLASSPGILGLSFNRKKQGWVSEIFVREGSLARVMLTLGHELGHVLTEGLNDKRDEEAKAYAFSLEWMRVLKENDIGGLGGGIVLDKPAENGIHNVAFEFVQKMISSGKKAWDVYLGLVRRRGVNLGS